jgi:hypothetical protein
VRGHHGWGASAVAAVLLTGGCTLLPTAAPAPAGPAPSLPPPASSTSAPGPSTPPGPSAGLPTGHQLPGSLPSSAAPTRTRAPERVGLRVEPLVVRGRSGSLSWDVDSVRFSGGPGASEVNRRVRAAVDDAVRRGQQEARRDGGERRRITGSSVVTTNDGRTVQVAAQFVDSLAGTAHPSLYVATTVVTTEAGRPILVTELFRDDRAAFSTFGTEVRRTARRLGRPVTDADGLAPRATNWDNWQTSAEGMTFLFDDGQLGMRGTPSYAVPWSVVEPLLTRDARRLLAPR